jgi:hypothetical protein
MNHGRSAGPCGSACSHVNLLRQVTDNRRDTDIYKVAASTTKIHNACFKENGAEAGVAPLFQPGAGGLEDAAKLTWNRGRATINGLAAEDNFPAVGDTPKPCIF